ncbi:MAG TPA: DUF4340 domain-containing protein, partial [Gemmataceae bacterium]|nr:DUF4340 domain-containing protein [Gemmataceae bacterium]
MNLKTTLVLTLLVAAGVLSWLFLLPRPGKRASDTLTLLEEQLTPAKLTSIEIKHGDRKVELSREGGEWSLPGKWPVRKAEVEALVGTLTSLRSRFEPIALGTPPDLARYGLDRDPLVVKVKTGGKEHKLTFGEKADETNHFSQATYLRLGESSEVVRLAPNLIGILERPQDYYRQRRLFPAERVAKESGSQEKVDLLLAKKVEVTSGATGYAVEKSDDGWRVRDLARDDAGQFKPGHIQDRADPETLKRIQAAVPDIWVERFVAAREKKEFGLDKPEQTVTVARPSGDTLTLLVGNISRKGPAKIQKSPFDPQMKIPPKVTFEEFRYARLKDNDQVFEVRTDRLKDLPTSVADLRDPQLARFAATDARRVEIDEDGRRLVFVHDKDKDRWRMEKPSAVDVEDAKVSELLNRLSGLEARGADIIDKADPKMSGLDKPASVKITLEEKKEGEKDKKTREVTFLLGKQAEKDRLYVQVAGTARINQVEDEVLKLVKRPALAYRSRRLLDVPTRDLVEIKVKRDAETLTLTQEKSDWKLTAPVQAEADAGKAAQLAGEVARLEAVEFIADNVSPEDLDKLYGLAKPAATVTVNFKDKEKAGRTLTLGKQRPGKQEFFARLDGDPTVFAVKKETHDILERDSLAYRPLNLWRLPPDGIAEVRILKTEPEYRLSREGGDWKVSGPFDAKVQAEQVRSMAKELADPDAERYVAHATKEPEKYGLDKPYLRVTVREALPKDAKEGKEHVLMIGGKADKGGRYAQRGGADGVFVLPEKLVAVIDRDALDLLDRKLLALDEN